MTTTDIDPNAPLRDDIRLMGNLLGDTLRQQVGQALYDKVEAIRVLGKQARDGNEAANQQLNQLLSLQVLDVRLQKKKVKLKLEKVHRWLQCLYGIQISKNLLLQNKMSLTQKLIILECKVCLKMR